MKKLINTVLFQLFVVSWNYGDGLGPSQARASHQRSQNQSKAEKAEFLQAFSMKNLGKKLKQLSSRKLCQARIVKNAEEGQFLKYFLFYRAGSEREAAEVPLPPSTKKKSLRTTNPRECGSRTVQAVL